MSHSRERQEHSMGLELAYGMELARSRKPESRVHCRAKGVAEVLGEASRTDPGSKLVLEWYT